VSLLNYPGGTAVQTTATMTVTECVVTAITPTPSLQGVTQSYTITDPQLVIPYDYVQVPACGYAMTVTPTETPASPAINHDAANKKFTVSLTDLNHATTGISVSALITLTGDTYTLTETFTVDVVNPCMTTTLDTFAPFRITVSELGVTSSTTLPQGLDSASSLNAGDGVTLCGPRVYTVLSPVTAWPATVTLTQSGVDSRTFTLDSTANTDAGTYTTQDEVHLMNYPSIKTQTTSTITVSECVVTAITPTPSLQGTTHTYSIFDAPLQIPYDYVQVPACGYPITFTPTISPATSAVTINQVNEKS